MRAKALCTALAISGAGTVTSAPVLLIAGGAFANYGQENVPGEDMGFPSSGSCVVCLAFDGTSLATGGEQLTSGGSVNIQTSNNYYADSGSGETFTTVATYAPAGGIVGNRVAFLDRVPLGEAILVQVVSVVTADQGAVTAYLLST